MIRDRVLGFDKVAFAQAIERELGKLPSTKKERTHTWVSCPFRAERTPSGKVNHDPTSPYLGRYFCFGCGAKASWQEFAEKVNLSPLNGEEFHTDKAPQFFAEFYQRTLLAQDDEPVEYTSFDDDVKELPVTDENAERLGLKGNEWRDFSLDFLRKILPTIRFRRRLLKVGEDFESTWFIRLPTVVNGIERGYSDAYLYKPKEKSTPSYRNKKGSWTKTFGLFPFDSAISLMARRDIKTMVLVEGQRDALRLIRYGIPAVAILGTNSWSELKIRLLELAGVERIILCMDGDIAGRDATKTLKPTLKEGFHLHVIRLWVEAEKLGLKKIDPGDMSITLIKRLKKLVYQS
jgi:5S rRNA maturation endonuclease (ribonuclease M5)